MIELIKKPLSLVNFLTGVIFIIAALIQIKFPPKKINSLYGYRTKNSMKSQEAWDFAQLYSAKLMLRFGGGLTLISLLLNKVSLSKPEYEVVASTFIISSVVILMLAIVEKELKKRF
jgi:uncharacterized membrane protein